MADEFDGNHQRRQGGHRPDKMLQIADSCVLESLRLVVRKSYKSATEWNDGHGGGRFEPRDHADQIAKQNKEKERRQKSGVAFAVMTDNLVALSLNESLDALKGVLECARAVH